MYIQENYLYKDKSTQNYLRIIWLEEETDCCWLIEFTNNAELVVFPYEISISDFEQLLPDLEFIELDTFSKVSPDVISSSVQKRMQDRFDFIKVIAEQRPEVFFPAARGKIIAKEISNRKKEIDDAKKAKKPKIEIPLSFKKTQTYELLKMFWIYGQNENSMHTYHSLCGGTGKKRKYKKGQIPGRKRKSISDTQLQLSDNDIKLIEEQFPKLVKRALGNKTRAHSMFCTQYWAKHKRKPSYMQFKHHGEKEYLKFPEKEDFHAKKNPSGRILESSARSQVLGPGSECQIDSTVDDTHLLSRTFDLRYFGRMTLYLAVDTFSAMPMGVLLCPLNPSYEALQLLIMNIATPKDEFMEKIGLKGKKYEDWPCKHIPAKFLTDRGPEYTGYNIESWPRNLQTQVDATPSGRPDLKAIVERYIKKLLDSIQIVLENKGLVHRNYGTRMGKDSKKEATLSYHDLLQIMVLEILHQIKYKKISKYPYTQKMIEERVQAYPLELWNWGRKKSLASLRVVDKDIVRRNILPYKVVTATTDGFHFRGIDFVPSTKEGRFVRRKILNSKNKQVRISYDETAFEVFLNYKSKQYALHSRLGIEFNSFIDYKRFTEDHKQKDEARKESNFQNRVETDQEQSSIVKSATKKKNSVQKITKQKVKTTDTRNTKSNLRKEYRESTRQSKNSTETADRSKLKMPSKISILKLIKR